MAEEGMLQDAIEAIRQEKFERARDILTRLLRNDPNNPTYWLWMSAAVPSRKEKVYCLENVLKYDPKNELAKQGLALFSAAPAETAEKLKPAARRKWKFDLQLPKNAPARDRRRRPIRRLIFVGGLFIFIILVVVAGIVLSPKKTVPVYIKPTKTPGPPPTFTPTPTYIGYVAPASTETMEESGEPSPLWMLLDATYTPTPVYINTPHPVSEAYRAGQVAYQQGNWQTAVEYFQQAQKLEPQAADILYYLGEAYRNSGDVRQALTTFQQAVQMDNRFAPAYLGRARCNLALNPKSDVLEDLNKAIALDANLAEAYLERANFYISQQKNNLAEADLSKAEALMPSSPMPYLLRARMYLKEQNAIKAFEEAKAAHDRDVTLLDIYPVYSEAALLNGKFDLAEDLANTYLGFRKKDAQTWSLYARALVGLGNQEDVYRVMTQGLDTAVNVQDALTAFDRAVTLNPSDAWNRLYRSVLYLEVEEGQKAINDLDKARSAVYQGANVNENLLWFGYQIALSRGFYLAGRFDSAVKQLDFAETLAKGDFQKAAVYYWRALTYEKMDKPAYVRRDCQSLMQLETEGIPSEWKEWAEEKLSALTPTAPAPTKTTPPALLTSTPVRTITPSPASVSGTPTP